MRKAEKAEKEGKLETAIDFLSEAESYLKNCSSSDLVSLTAKHSIEAQILAVHSEIKKLKLKLRENRRMKEFNLQSEVCSEKAMLCEHVVKAKHLANKVYDHNLIVDEMKETIAKLSLCLQSLGSSLGTDDSDTSRNVLEAQDYTAKIDSLATKLSAKPSNSDKLNDVLKEPDGRKVTVTILDENEDSSMCHSILNTVDKSEALHNQEQKVVGDFDIELPVIVPLELPTFDFTVFKKIDK
ncbi:hypothetical protein QYM36_017188 [Artemia franciscana]|uniref:Uncharacterized protein n=2 Tax=Artemia franciscana TaxID=6661 RepID=A0AA88H7I2_ARTSF|nr:hypothetical protein QYM36_017188 [Artemia franciscana]